MNMKKITSIFGLLFILVIAIIVLKLFSGLGFGFGNGFGFGEGDSGIETKANNSIIKENIDSEEEKSDIDISEIRYVQISVVEQDYYYENERISLDELINKIMNLEGKIIVEIKDDKASLNAYNSLIEKLDNEKISYIDASN